MTGITDTFKDHGADWCLTSFLEPSYEGLAPQESMLLKAESHKPHRTRHRRAFESVSYLKQHRQCAGIVIRARRCHDRIVMRANEQRSLLILDSSPSWMLDGKDITIDLAPCSKGLVRRRPSIFRKLRR